MQNTQISYHPNAYQTTLRHFGQMTTGQPPEGILPMHNHPKATIPHETQKKWNHLASVGVGTTILGALLLISTRFKAVETLIIKNVPEQTWKNISQKKLSDRAWQIIGLGSLMQTINRYETAVNTNQPSKLAAAMASTIQAVGFLFTSNWFFQAIAFVTAALLYAGEQNDIENSNHPDKRREWDLSRLGKGIKDHTFAKEMGSAAKFIVDDFKHAFSAEHWRSLRKTPFGKNMDWQTPQSYQSALGVQFSTISLGIIAIANGFQKYLPAPAFNFIQKYLGGGTNIIGSAIPQLPLIIRAWQNNDQVDGRLVLAGAPLITLGRLLQMIEPTKYLGGLGFVGDALKGKGLALNSQKYLALLNQMRAIQKLTERDPYITATTVLNLMSTSPDVTDRLRQQMGQPRLDFLIQLLKKAETEYQQNGTSLNAFLKPLLETNNHTESP